MIDILEDPQLKQQLQFYDEKLLSKEGYEKTLDNNWNLKPKIKQPKKLDIDFNEIIDISLNKTRIAYLKRKITSNQVKTAFDIWKNERYYYVLENEAKNNYISVKCSKRGNDIYCFQTKQKFDDLISVVRNNFGDLKFFNEVSDHKQKRTGVLFFSLTYRRDISNIEAWLRVGRDYNNFISAIKYRYGDLIVICRNWENQNKDDYPHIHFIAIFLDYSFSVFNKNEKWRIREKKLKHQTKKAKEKGLKRTVKGIESLWKNGYSDIEAVSDMEKAVKYLAKHTIKYVKSDNVDKTLAMTWVFEKQAYAISENLKEKHDLINKSIIQSFGFSDKEKYHFYGLFDGNSDYFSSENQKNDWFFVKERPPPDILKIESKKSGLEFESDIAEAMENLKRSGKLRNIKDSELEGYED